ncbi:Pet117 protein [Pichia kluyveri]|uniref:Pet117 protein n=1 Tax=Pichia kluyveri TaxID=36015 RepID=A0AAV5R6I4_PICKL|nr:Pet117 protein [Pichia kluyveri]
MSRASKITLVLSTALSITTIGAVYFMAENEKDQLQEGPIKDRKRLERREFNSKQQANLNEYEKQKEIFAEMEKIQPLTGEIVQGIDTRK